MAIIKGIERLEGRGVKAKVLSAGGMFTTYRDFAKAVGYPDAVNNGMAGKVDDNKGTVYDVLAKGKHEYSDYGYVYVLESEDGERFLIGEGSIEIVEFKKDLSEMVHTELERIAVDAIAELTLKAYEEGYKQGKFGGAVSGEYFGKKVRKTSQERRDEIIERAKADIESLKREGEAYGRSFTYREYLDGYSEFSEGSGDAYNAEFIVNRGKRTVVVLLIGWGSDKVVKRGIAKCASGDCFNVHIGKAIALRRALGLEVPDEYLNAPQPTEARLGDVIDSKSSFGHMTIGKYDDIGNGVLSRGTYSNLRGTRIIDDSREGVDE